MQSGEGSPPTPQLRRLREGRDKTGSLIAVQGHGSVQSGKDRPVRGGSEVPMATTHPGTQGMTPVRGRRVT